MHTRLDDLMMEVFESSMEITGVQYVVIVERHCEKEPLEWASERTARLVVLCIVPGKKLQA